MRKSISGNITMMIFETHKKAIPVEAKLPPYRLYHSTRVMFTELKRIDTRQFDGLKS